jgi:hypothetical protein
MLSRGQKHSVSMEHWIAAHRAFAVDKNNESMVKTRRLFRRRFSIHRKASMPSKNTIKSSAQSFRKTASAIKKSPP